MKRESTLLLEAQTWFKERFGSLVSYPANSAVAEDIIKGKHSLTDPSVQILEGFYIHRGKASGTDIVIFEDDCGSFLIRPTSSTIDTFNPKVAPFTITFKSKDASRLPGHSRWYVTEDGHFGPYDKVTGKRSHKNSLSSVRDEASFIQALWEKSYPLYTDKKLERKLPSLLQNPRKMYLKGHDANQSRRFAYAKPWFIKTVNPIISSCSMEQSEHALLSGEFGDSIVPLGDRQYIFRESSGTFRRSHKWIEFYTLSYVYYDEEGKKKVGHERYFISSSGEMSRDVEIEDAKTLITKKYREKTRIDNRSTEALVSFLDNQVSQLGGITITTPKKDIPIPTPTAEQRFRPGLFGRHGAPNPAKVSKHSTISVSKTLFTALENMLLDESNVDLIRELIKTSDNLDVIDDTRGSLLDFAKHKLQQFESMEKKTGIQDLKCREKYQEIITLLIDKGVKTTSKHEKKLAIQSVDDAVSFGTAQDLEKALNNLPDGVDVSSICEGRFSPLMRAVTCRDLAKVNLLLDMGVDCNYQEPKRGRTALFYAAEKREREIYEALLNAAADPSIKDKHGMTALEWGKEYNKQINLPPSRSQGKYQKVSTGMPKHHDRSRRTEGKYVSTEFTAARKKTRSPYSVVRLNQVRRKETHQTEEVNLSAFTTSRRGR